MSKGLFIVVALALAFSNAAFAKGGKRHHSSLPTKAEMAQMTVNDCRMLSVRSARGQCVRAVHAHAGRSDRGMGATMSSSGMSTAESSR
jgi:hypothetical protein